MLMCKRFAFFVLVIFVVGCRDKEAISQESRFEYCEHLLTETNLQGIDWDLSEGSTIDLVNWNRKSSWLYYEDAEVSIKFQDQPAIENFIVDEVHVRRNRLGPESEIRNESCEYMLTDTVRLIDLIPSRFIPFEEAETLVEKFSKKYGVYEQEKFNEWIKNTQRGFYEPIHFSSRWWDVEEYEMVPQPNISINLRPTGDIGREGEEWQVVIEFFWVSEDFYDSMRD